MSADRRWRLFEATGVELEYMIVDRKTLSIRPIADRVLEAVGGSGETEVDLGDVAWSNELALHVIEIKTNGPVTTLDGLAARFHDSVRRIDAVLEPHGARLMPTAMHPWMDPHTELAMWPHEQDEIYRAFHRIFDCRGHGWANLQSMHVNLPFADDDEFGRLHAAIRMILPILPALAASSPFADGAATGFLDTRMEFYRKNAARVPSVSGLVVPERVFTRVAYEGELLRGIYEDLAPHDPDGILRHEWVNARGAIARFDRGAIEIRILDLQECPSADLAVCAAVVAAVRAAAEGRLGDPEEHRRWSEADLAAILRDSLRDAGDARIEDPSYARALGLPGSAGMRLADLWRALLDSTVFRDPASGAWREALETILDEGPLARRILDSTGPTPDRARLAGVYAGLCACLDDDRVFRAQG